MTKKIDNHNFLNSKSILLLSRDKELCDKVTVKLSNLVDNFKIENSIYDIDFLNFDLLIIDIDFFDAQYLNNALFNTKLKEMNIPVVYLTSSLDSTILECIDNVPLKNIILKGEQLEFIYVYISLILKKNSKVYFNHDYSFCLDKNKFFFKEKEISLTNLEFRFLKYLVEHKNRLIDYETIIDYVWEGKDCSIFSMRNIVNKIREKSFYEIIKNISNKGYIINDYKIY